MIRKLPSVGCADETKNEARRRAVLSERGLAIGPVLVGILVFIVDSWSVTPIVKIEGSGPLVAGPFFLRSKVSYRLIASG